LGDGPEMGPRDGLQNEARPIPTPDKIKLVNMLSGCGFSHIEASSFVSPKWVPQMADGAEVMAGITRRPGIAYTAIAPNVKGYERAREAEADAVGIFGSASDGFSRANVNCGMDEALERARPIIDQAKADGMMLPATSRALWHAPMTAPSILPRLRGSQRGCSRLGAPKSLSVTRSVQAHPRQ